MPRRFRARCRRERLAAVLGVVVAGLFLGHGALAEGMPRALAIELVNCEPAPFPDAELAAGLELELAQAGVAELATAPNATVSPEGGRLRIAVVCHAAPPAARLVLEDGAGHRAEREVELGDLRVALWPRTIALAAAELVRSTWPAWVSGEARPPSPTDEGEEKVAAPEPATATFPAEGAPDPPSPLAPPGPPVEREVYRDEDTAKVEPPRAASPAPIWLSAAARSQSFFAPVTTQWGFAAGAQRRRLEFGLSYYVGIHSDPAGLLRSRRGELTAGWQAVRLARTRTLLALEPRAAVGFVAVKALAEVGEIGHDTSTPYIELGLATTGSVFVGGRCALALSLAAGAARGFVAVVEGNAIARFDGATVGAAFGGRCQTTKPAGDGQTTGRRAP